MPAPYHSIEDRLNRYQTGLTNARDVPELPDMLDRRQLSFSTGEHSVQLSVLHRRDETTTTGGMKYERDGC